MQSTNIYGERATVHWGQTQEEYLEEVEKNNGEDEV